LELWGGFRAKLVKRKTDTLTPTSEGEGERAEKERGEDPTQRLFPQTKIILINLSR
jgi:chromatin segregation and condensation protein Rec8/ScpA/Scc1 (kleisin family)